MLPAWCGRRIIPARAGFTRPPRRRWGCGTDHPRSRGVYYPCYSEQVVFEGSSPLARGLRCVDRNPGRCARIIPARAGFTRSGFGEAVDPGGSSPLARGLRIHVAGHRILTRIIPARAGFTSTSCRYARRRRDHPRSRGVYDETASAAVAIQGSSPLARGLRSTRDGEVRDGGIIPARAGFTFWSRSWIS